MSAEEIKRFNDAVQADAGMQDEVKALSADVEGLLAYANGKGYSFTADDVSALAGKTDLSDDELDQVSGGQVVFVAGAGAGAIAILNG